MTKRLHLARPVAVLAAVALGSTALLGLAPAAVAATATGDFIVGTSFSTGGAAGCALKTDTSSSAQAPFGPDGVAIAGSLSSTATVEDAGDLADDTTMTAKAGGRVRATEAAGSLDTLTLTVALSASVTAAQGLASQCDSRAQAQSGAQAYFTLAQPGWLTLHGTSQGGSLQATVVRLGLNTEEGTVGIAAGLKSEQSRQFLLDAGTYLVLAIYTLEVLTPNLAGEPSSGIGGGGVELGFTPVGDATGPATGPGQKYLRLDRALSCGAGSVSAAFTGKAGPVQTATFFVNGKRSKVVTVPGAGSDVVLRGLPSSSGVLVKAVLKLKTGGSKTVSRSYASCS